MASHGTYTITCPTCRSMETEEFGEPIHGTDDHADCARCRTCGKEWGLDYGADFSCTECGGSGRPGAGPMYVRRNGQLEPTPECPCVGS